MSRLRSIVDRTYEAYNARDFDAYRELFDEHVEFVMAGVAVRGRDALTDFVAADARVRPGLRIELQRVFAEADDTLVTEIGMIDTAPAGSAAEAGPVESGACALYRVAGGRIVELRVYADPASEDLRAIRMAVAAEQSALRRVAELVAQRAPPEQVFALVTEELSQLLGVHMIWTVRFEPDGSATVLAARGRAAHRMPPGTHIPRLVGGVLDHVFRTGSPAWLDDYTHVHGLNDAAMFERLRDHGVSCGAAGPIIVGGRTWGAMLAASQTTETLPSGIEGRIAQFAELASTAISNIESQAEVERLATEQSGLRRVAELVARHAPAEQVFDLVNEELSLLLDVNLVRTVRFEPDGTATVLASRGAAEDRLGPGTNAPLPRGTVIEKVFNTGRPASVHGYEQVPGPVGEVLREQGARSGAGGPIVVHGRLWGAMAVGSTTRTLAPGTEDRVAKFAELVSTAISNIESRANVERLAAEQSALRRVATLVARAPASERVFSTVAREVASVLNVPGVIVQRYEPDGTVVTFGDAFHADLARAERFLGVGTRMPRDPGSLAAQVFDTHRAARIDDFSTLPGTIGDLARAAGLGSGCAGPIVVNGALWGKMCVFSRVGTVLPVGTEHRLHDFIELVGTAIANYESRVKVERLAAEQSALRRVATLVAREHSPEDLFATLAEELGVLLGVDAATILRYEDGGSSATVVARWTNGVMTLPVGERLTLEGESLVGDVYRAGAPRRKEDYSRASGVIGSIVRTQGIRSAVASPIVVEGATWGVLAAVSRQREPLPPDTEARLAEFSRVAGMAVANANSRSDLAESRARIVRAGDEARRRFERDLHDGAQQRLVSLGMELRAAEASVPPDLGELPGVLSRLGTGLTDVLDDLRELSRGLHPAVLSEDGLVPALHSLALRSAVPVDLRVDLDGHRFEEPVEVAAYYVASEALTNTAKHAHASRAQVSVTHRNGWLELSVSDDGSGGAIASRGSGLTGLVDRVEAIGGTIEIDSPLDGGTTLTVKLPARQTSHDRLATTPP